VERQKARPIFVCAECGQESVKWQGRCPECEAWNSFVERAARPPAQRRTAAGGASVGSSQSQPVELAALAAEAMGRLPLNISEFDRVLGGGVVPGSLILIGGDPGIGKSTLILQAAERLTAAGRTVLYLSGEESAHQIKLRAQRLGVAGKGLFLLGETNLDEGLGMAERLNADLVIVDSIQTVYTSELPNAPGSIAQLRGCTMRLMQWAKANNVPAIIVGHVTKEGEIAGPRLLEHIVDVVLYLEGERFSSYRLLRGVKNRFGAVSEIGVFEMGGRGMEPVENPSEMFLAERADGAVGSVIAPTIEGSRPLLVEVQALTSPSPLTMPRRTAQGIEFSRLLLLTAVLTKRVGLALGSQDVIVNVVGGLRVQEPAVDLATALAIVSSFRDRPIAGDTVAFGEIGLSGELRSCAHLDRRLAEAAKLGFRRCILPWSALRRGRPDSPMELLAARTVGDAVDLAMAPSR
jgi:DNA repair protein RadA/Sms